MNNYEAPEALKLGKARDLVLDQKQPGDNDNLGCPICNDAPTFDDVDEQLKGIASMFRNRLSLEINCAHLR